MYKSYNPYSEKSEVFRGAKVDNILPVLYLFGVIWHLWSVSYDLVVTLTPFFLFGSAVYLYILIYRYGGKKALIHAIIISILGFFIEVIGVQTGLIFGDYEYSGILGPKLFGTVLLIGPLWFIVVYGAKAVVHSRFIGKGMIRQAFAVGLMLVILDLFLEVVAIKIGYWDWGGSVPLQNYIAWFVISFGLSILADWFGFAPNRELLRALRSVFLSFSLFIILLFFLL